MPDYTYYPGCSLEATSPAYAESTCATMAALGANLFELDDWNCCGATAYMAVSELTSFVISARNLALAKPHGRDVVTPCSGCFVGLNKTNRYFEEFPEIKERVNIALAEAGLSYDGSVRVRHLLDVVVNDIGLDTIASRVKRPLTGLKVACYSGCQLVRPETGLDDAEVPELLERLTTALGAEPVYFPMKAVCCGGSLMGTEQRIGLRLAKDLIRCAIRQGADIMIVPCPLCQINLDAFQGKIRRLYGKDRPMPILFFSQLIGIALGLKPKEIGLGREIVSAKKVLKPYL